VAGGQPTAYDRARAIEQFLRQYPYSLDLPPPPEGDIVDYFLFDLQTGFCDYYASAMVVMARAVGLPARLGVGFLQQPTVDGVQTIRQIDAHSWAEIYFEGYGWVEFEPTTPFAAPVIAPAGPSAPGPATPIAPVADGITIPERAPRRGTAWVWWLALGAAALALVGWRLWGRAAYGRWRAPREALDDVQQAYARLLAGAASIGQTPDAAQTPAEFAAELAAAPELSRAETSHLGSAIERLARLFSLRQYGRALPPTAGGEAQAAWGVLRVPLRRLAWRQRLGKLRINPSCYLS
jgi:hypothetical protein